jgi:sulfite exporter TauE/SafE
LSVQLTNWLSEIKNFLPWVSFLAGLGGSLHCVGMCGGLVTASCDKSSDVVRYQFGRLLGYLTLGLLAGGLGVLINLKSLHFSFQYIPSLVIGLIFIYWGIQNYLGKKAEMPAPKILGRLYSNLWGKLIKNNKSLTKSFFIGLLSIFLPCGLLYGVVLGTLVLNNPIDIFSSMFFFWLGTTPSMVVAPSVVQKVLRPFKSKLPKTYAISLIAIGVLTISFRVAKLNENMHQPETKLEDICH